MTQNGSRRRGLLCLLGCFCLWGFQPLYWSLFGEIDTVFLMACRIVWAACASVAVLKLQGKLGQLRALFRDKRVLLREIPAALFLLADWAIYLWAVRAGMVLQCSMGYYIQPLVVFTFGALLFHEPITWRHIAILGIMAAGVLASVGSFGGFPWVTVAVALCFAVYSAIKKSLPVDSTVSTTAEILLLAPAALLIILIFCRGDGGLASVDLSRQILLLGAGIVTAAPMLLFSVGVRELPLTTVGVCQYLSPTLSVIAGVLLGESLTRDKIASFAFIWAGVILYVLNGRWEEKRKKAKETE